MSDKIVAMKATITAILILMSLASFGASKSEMTRESLMATIKERDIAFKLEVEYPDRDTAYYLAYKKCGDKVPVEPVYFNEFDEYRDHATNPKGYEKIYYYYRAGIMPYYYKCEE